MMIDIKRAQIIMTQFLSLLLVISVLGALRCANAIDARQSDSASTELLGRWRTMRDGPLGAGVVQLDINLDDSSKPVVLIDGQMRGYEPLELANIVIDKTAMTGELAFVPYDVSTRFLRSPVRLEATLEGDGQFLVVTLDNKEHDEVLVFERDGAKYRRFDTPLLSADNSKLSEYVYATPSWRADDDIMIAALEDVGLKPHLFESIVRDGILRDEYPRITSLLVMKDGKLVFEEYFNGNDADNLHLQASVSKTITALMYGVLLEKQSIESFNRPIISYFPEHKNSVWGKNAVKASARDFLLMKDLVGWNESGSSSMDGKNFLWNAYDSGDLIGYLFDQPLIQIEERRAFAYNTSMTNALGVALTRQLDQSLLDITFSTLLDPMNIGRAYWGKHVGAPYHPPGGAVPLAGTTLHLRSRDMTKIGQLLLDMGAWNGRQIVPADWVREMTQVHSVLSESWTAEEWGYGYQIWHEKLSDGTKTMWAVSARGHGGQLIYVVPALNAVIVTTATWFYPDNEEYYGRGKPAWDLVLERVLPAIGDGTTPWKRQSLSHDDIGYDPIASIKPAP